MIGHLGEVIRGNLPKQLAGVSPEEEELRSSCLWSWKRDAFLQFLTLTLNDPQMTIIINHFTTFHPCVCCLFFLAGEGQKTATAVEKRKKTTHKWTGQKEIPAPVLPNGHNREKMCRKSQSILHSYFLLNIN